MRVVAHQSGTTWAHLTTYYDYTGISLFLEVFLTPATRVATNDPNDENSRQPTGSCYRRVTLSHQHQRAPIILSVSPLAGLSRASCNSAASLGILVRVSANGQFLRRCSKMRYGSRGHAPRIADCDHGQIAVIAVGPGHISSRPHQLGDDAAKTVICQQI